MIDFTHAPSVSPTDQTNQPNPNRPQGAELRLQNAAGRLCAAAFSDNLFELQRLVENGINCNEGQSVGRLVDG